MLNLCNKVQEAFLEISDKISLEANSLETLEDKIFQVSANKSLNNLNNNHNNNNNKLVKNQTLIKTWL
jgi:hypothetical protein